MGRIKISLVIFLFLMTTFAQKKLDIYFDFDQFELNDAAVKKINSWIAEGTDYKVIKLYGFCDSKGTNSYNDTLALNRVKQVYKFLKDSDIEVQKSIQIRGFGEDFEQSTLQRENRRVTIIYLDKNENSSTISKSDFPKEVLKNKMKLAKKGDLIKLDFIYFFNNSAKIVPKSEPILYELLCVMNDNPKLVIEIQGHICCKTPQQEDAISAARAKTVYNFLIRNKIDRKRLTSKGYGVSRPIHPIPEKNSLEEDENRRVEILIIEN
jgi:outer membrane protein OmpA-like peptidoglycan-associated protein